MIEEKGNDKITKHEREEIKAFCKVSVFSCIHALEHFLTLLGLDKDLLNHLFDTKIIIDYTNLNSIDNYVAYYNDDGEEITINILGDYIDNILTCINASNDELISDDIDELAITLMHEYLHVNRDIMIKSDIDDMDEYYKKCDMLLDKKLMDNEHDKIMILDIEELNDRFITYVYNFYTNSYDIFSINKNEFNGISYYNIINKIRHRVKLYYLCNKLYIGLSNIELIDSYNLEIPNSIIKSSFELDENSSIKLEESLIEVFAKIIIYNKYDEKLKIKEYCDKIINDKNTSQDLKNACLMVKNMDIETIKSFLLSSYMDEHNSKILKHSKKE